MARLTPKQKRFVEEYLVDLNATQAAIRAGYSKKRASETGYQLLQKTTVSKAIQEAMDKRSERTGITGDQVIKQLAKIAFADIKDVVVWNNKEVVVDTDKKTGKPVTQQELTIDVKSADEVDGTILSEITETTNHQGRKIGVKLNDRMKALELLGRHLGLFDPKMKHIDDLSSAQLEKIKAESEFLREKTKMLKGAAKDTSLMEALIDVVKES